MVALLHDVAVLHHQDEVGVLDGGEPVGDDKAGAALHQVGHGVLDEVLGSGIHRGGGLIQNHDLVVGQDGPGDGQKLLLALGDVGGVLVELHLVGPGEGLDEVVDVGGLGGGDDLLIAGVQAAVADVLHDGALEQPGILEHHAEGLPQVGPAEVPHVVSVHPDSAGVDVVEPHEQLDHGGLARAGGANDGHHLPRLHVGGEVVDDDLVRIVAEVDVVKVHAALHIRQRGGLGGVGGLLLFIQELKDPLGGGGHGLEHVGDLRNLSDGLGEVLHVLDEGLDITHLDDAGHRQHAAGHRHGHIAQVAHKVHDGLHHAGEELALPGGLEQNAVGLVKSGLDGLLLVESPDDVVAGIALLHLTVDVSQVLLLGLEVLLGVLHHNADEQHGHGQDDNGDEGHQGTDGEHHDEHADDHGHRSDELGDALVKALSHGVHVVGDAGEDLAHGAGLKVLHGHAVDLFRDIPAHAVGHFLGNAAHNPALDGAEEGGQEIHPQE